MPQRFIRRNWPALLLLISSVVFLLYGLARGEGAVVVQKAIRICLECIGIG